MEINESAGADNDNPSMSGSADRLREIVTLLKSVGKRVQCEAGHNILCEGGDCDFFFYVVSGTFRAFRWMNDKEVTTGFIFPGELVMCPFFLIDYEARNDIIEALSNGEIIKVFRKDFEEINRNEPDYGDFVNYMLSNYIEGLLKKLAEFKAHTAEKIYLDLIHDHSAEITVIPLKYIASYLGVSQERLSRIRKKYPHLT